MFPPLSPAEFAAVLLAEFIFGIGYNTLVAWGQRKRLWEEAREGTLTAGHLPDYVHRLHQVIGTLKSV